MAKYIAIKMEDGSVFLVRSELETASESPLTQHEIIINDLYKKLKKQANE